VALRASTSTATVLEWDVGANGVLYKVLICGVMAVCVSRKSCLFCVLISVRDGERLGVSGSANVTGVLFLGACACARQSSSSSWSLFSIYPFSGTFPGMCCFIHLICFFTLPRTLNGAPFLLPITCPVLRHFLVHECASPASSPY